MQKYNLEKIKIVYIGLFREKNDEGLSQISKKISELVSASEIVLNINTKEVLQLGTLLKIYNFKPDIIHYLTGPTIRSLIVLLFLKTILLFRVKTIISATRPFLRKNHFKFLRFFSIDLVFTQAKKWENIFQNMGITTTFLPNPIDTNKFSPLTESKDFLRKKYNLSLDKKIILHVGHIRNNRNIKTLIDIQQSGKIKNFIILVVASNAISHDKELISKIEASGIILLTNYLNNIEEIYRLADLYIFPVKGLEKDYYPKSYNEVGVIDMPLSILEALSVGLPIISTKCDAIENLISEYQLDCGIRFWDGTVKNFWKIIEKNDLKERYHNQQLIKRFNQISIKTELLKTYSNIL